MEVNQVISADTTCFHCGDVISNSKYLLNDHTFCCLGCQTVYQVLLENNLSVYYKYGQHPGQRKAAEKQDLSYLDEPAIVSKLVDYMDDEKLIITFYIPSIHCSACIWLLEHLYKLNAGITSSRVDFMKKQASFTLSVPDFSLRGLVELLDKIGYSPKITFQDVVKKGKQFDHNNLIGKLAVAGFCFGNSMMISFPDYFGIGEFEKNYAEFFGYLNLVFGLPVLLYSASDYFKSAWLSLKNRQLNLDVPLAIGIGVLFFRSAYEILTGIGAGFIDTLCSLVFFILIGKWVQQKTYYHISFERDYRSYFPVAVTVIENDLHRPVQLGDLSVGDRVLIRNNEIIPADAILLTGKATVDFSFVTGESEPVIKVLGEIIYAGGRQVGEAIELEVVKPVSQSYLTRLWNNDSFKQPEKKFDTFVGYISKYFTLVLLLVATTALVFWGIQGAYHKAWAAFTAVLIIACPCALALSSPFTLSAALSIFDRNKLYFKNTAAIEQMASIGTIFFDKTGTISSPAESSIQFVGTLSNYERSLVASLCRNSNHPLSQKILKNLGQTDVFPVSEYEELIGAGQKGEFTNVTVQIGSADFVGVRHPIERVGSYVFVKINEVIKGHFTIDQFWRDGLNMVLNSLHQSNYQLHLLSGDNDRQVEDLRSFFPDQSQLFFEQRPQDKLDKIKRWQQSGERICMFGDGLNDAGALQKADLGIAVSDDINNFSPGCDAILDGASFHKLPVFFTFSKDAVRVIKMSFFISFLYNVIGLSFAVQGTMSPLFAAILMPISTATIISFTSLMTRFYGKRRGLVQ